MHAATFRSKYIMGCFFQELLEHTDEQKNSLPNIKALTHFRRRFQLQACLTPLTLIKDATVSVIRDRVRD